MDETIVFSRSIFDRSFTVMKNLVSKFELSKAVKEVLKACVAVACNKVESAFISHIERRTH